MHEIRYMCMGQSFVDGEPPARVPRVDLSFDTRQLASLSCLEMLHLSGIENLPSALLSPMYLPYSLRSLSLDECLFDTAEGLTFGNLTQLTQLRSFTARRSGVPVPYRYVFSI